ncbi:MAG: hypothetical protein JJE04_09580 [Acidobacteriia bacterium]|nr:hypothetical protein [Terriglobia bacterium]
MQLFQATTIFVTRTVPFALLIALCLQGQSTPGQDARTETRGIPPRAAPGDYQFQAQAGTVTIAAEFTGHSLPTLEGPLTTEDYVAVEAALFGPAGAPIKISARDFSLRVNGKKTPLPSQPYGLILSSLKDPEWAPPEAPAPKSKSSIGSGGQGQGDGNLPPAPVKIPIPVQRAMAQRVQKASLPEGDRALPQAGLIFFQYRGNDKNLQSIELLYEGPAGKAALKLRQ